MYISGLQKLTLLDFPGRLAATLFLDGCSFRCPFCYNSGLVLKSGADHAAPDQIFAEDEILRFLKKRTGMLDGVCISGGEPTLHRELPSLIQKIRALGFQVKLDTNGTNPEMLELLLGEKLLDYVAMDIKAGRKNYASAAGLKEHTDRARELLSCVARSAELLKSCSIEYEFRTTVVRGLHTTEDFEDIALWIAGCRNYFLQSFQDCDTILLPDHPFSAFSPEEMRRFLAIVKRTVPGALLRGME